eukprot:COSAG02_NODE_59240_length_275_cov_0.534091_1_plen_60_part_10
MHMICVASMSPTCAAVLPVSICARNDANVLRAVAVTFFNDTATTEIYTIAYTLSLHDALP